MQNTVLLNPEVDRLIQLALDEDRVLQDLTTQACGFSPSYPKTIQARVIAKKRAIAAGFPLVEKIFHNAQVSVKSRALVEEGKEILENTTWIELDGNPYDILRLERVLLNFLMRACGIATSTHVVVKSIEKYTCKLLHTRKTAPGHRYTDIYAALVGGANPHRQNLEDAILLKENHLQCAASIQAALDGIQAHQSQTRFVEIEVRDVFELKYALQAKPDRILLDNFKIPDLHRVVELYGGSVPFEASGGITPDNAWAYAETGVEFISMGSITHSACAADLSLDCVEFA